MKKICVVTGTRAEYGLLKPIMDLIQRDGQLSLQLIVTGSHLCDEFGNTFQDIEKDGFSIDYKVDLYLVDDTAVGISNSMAKAISGFAVVLDKMKPDALVLLGDRYEMLMAAVAGTIAKIPLVHLYGGETTEGAFDEAFRHCITKMSYLHFTSTDEYRKRVIQLGEHPDRVFNVGAIGIENIKKLRLLSLSEIQQEVSFKINEKTLLLTFHPVTLDNDSSGIQFNELLQAIETLQDIRVIFTKANADIDGKGINYLIDNFVSEHSDRTIAFSSMGQLRYLSTMKYVSAVVGNSSSGIIEAPTLNVPTINIGDRQKGRLQAKSILNCDCNKTDIIKAIHQVLDPLFRLQYVNQVNPYEGQNTADRIVAIIKNVMMKNNIVLKKSFYDLYL